MTLKHYSKRYEIILQGTFPKDRKDSMLASLMSEMEVAFNIPMQQDLAWELENEEVIKLYRQVSRSRNL